MDRLLRLFRKFSFLVRRKQFSDELEAEMAFHREQVETDLIAGGMSAEDAQHAAARQFGNTVALKEQSRDAIGFQFETALQDLRYAARQLRKNPGFAATAILILALGIGATTAIFSAVNPILFKSLPYPHPDRLMAILEMKDGGSRLPSFGTFTALSQQNHSFDAMAVMKVWRPAMPGMGEPEFFWGQRVSVGYFRSLCAVPALGRDFQPADDQHYGPNVLILSNRLWHRRFGADRYSRNDDCQGQISVRLKRHLGRPAA